MPSSLWHKTIKHNMARQGQYRSVSHSTHWEYPTDESQDWLDWSWSFQTLIEPNQMQGGAPSSENQVLCKGRRSSQGKSTAGNRDFILMPRPLKEGKQRLLEAACFAVSCLEAPPADSCQTAHAHLTWPMCLCFAGSDFIWAPQGRKEVIWTPYVHLTQQIQITYYSACFKLVKSVWMQVLLPLHVELPVG